MSVKLSTRCVESPVLTKVKSFSGWTCPICLTGSCKFGSYLCDRCQEIENEREYESNKDIYWSQFEDEETQEAL